MTKRLLLAACLLPMLPAAAQTPAKVAKPTPTTTALASARTLLKGTWQSTEDKSYRLVITDTQYREVYDGVPEASATYRWQVLDRSCEPAAGAQPTGQLYVRTIASDPANNGCFYLVALDKVGLELSPVGGRGNTLSFRRVKQPGGHSGRR